MGNAFGKSGEDLALAFEEVANTPGITKPNAAEILGIHTDDPDQLPDIDPEACLLAAAAIRAGGVPTFWPWIWFIPWINYTPPSGGDTTT